jgi:N-acetylglucosamine-6-phosphate deacetylase
MSGGRDGQLVLVGCRVVTPAAVIEQGRIVVGGGRVTEVGTDRPDRGFVVHLGGRWVLPGFIDLHVHGGGGADLVSGDPDEVLRAARFHLAHGTTALLASLVTRPGGDLGRLVGLVSDLARRRVPGEAALLGTHLEGPFLSPDRPGALDPRGFRPPDHACVDSLLEAGRGTVRMVTVAPELPGATRLIRSLARRGVVAALGHTAAGYDEARAGVSAGARHATHLFNAMPPFHHRQPGAVGAILEDPRVSCELILDGVHVHPAAARLAWSALGPQRLVLVTDAMAGAGMPDGSYRIGSIEVRVEGGRAMTHEGAIAGSTLTLDLALRHASEILGVDMVVAARLLATNPARILGLDHERGSLEPGKVADLVVLGDDLTVDHVMTGGRWVAGLEPGES